MPLNLSDIYTQKVAQGDISPDLSQANAILVLNSLLGKIVTPQRWWSKIFFHSSSPFPFQGVYLYGPVGRGKTRLMDLFFETVPLTIKKRRVHFHAFMLSVHDFLHTQRVTSGHAGVDDSLPKFAAAIAHDTHVLCFDEFHVVDVADAMILKRLFTALFDAGIYIVMTSNRAPDDLYLGGLQRDLFLPFIDIIKTCMAIIKIDSGRDYRLERLAGRPLYFYPLGTTADNQMDTLFRHLTDDTAPETADLLVKGHTLHIPYTAHGVARFTFSDLCEKPLAAQDYLELAEQFHTVMIDHVPKFTYDRRNETKRFVILIDILYERGRRVILSTDAPLDHLMADNDHAFEFERTLSRLQEMQSAAWNK